MLTMQRALSMNWGGYIIPVVEFRKNCMCSGFSYMLVLVKAAYIDDLVTIFVLLSVTDENVHSGPHNVICRPC
jgi:hypothetical protein